MSVHRAALAVAAAGLALTAAPAGAEQSTTQRFFSARLQDDAATSREVRALLRSGEGFVDRGVAFKDLTGDDRADAVVRVQSGGASGAIAADDDDEDEVDTLEPDEEDGPAELRAY